MLDLPVDKTKRIVFHEITKPAILRAIETPRTIDMNLVNAQQARRILDRLVGFELSPVLWKKVRPSLSAGRVQSVAVRLIVEREREIIAFRSAPYFRVVAQFHAAGDAEKSLFRAELSTRFETEAEAEAVYADIAAATDESLVLERQLAKLWSEIYDQKTYVYSYFLEKENREDILEITESMLGEARQEKLSSADNCVSEAVADYCLQKPVVLNYEIYVAKLLNQTAAIDSLSNASKNVRQIDFRMPPVEVKRRSFVDYEAIEFTPRSPYNASNPIPDCIVYEYGTIYRILLGTYKYKQAVSTFRGASPLCVETLEDGRFSYYAGGLKTRAEAETARISLRNARRDAVEAFKKAQKEGMSEDESKDGEAQSQKLLEKFSKTVDTAVEKKEKEVMTV